MITPSRTWTVDEASHAAFVQLSGDLNPIHTDELAARRLPFGEVVVHGVHVLLRALDHWAAANPDLAPTHLSATFRQPVGIGSSLTAAWSEPTDDGHLDRGANNQVDIAVDAHGVRAVDIRIAVVTASTDTAADQVTESLPALTTRMLYPTGWAIEELDGRSGAVPVDADTAALVAMFPALVAVTGMAAARELVALTALVGMHVPGLHSMFSSLSVEFGSNGSITGSPDGLAYEVTLVDRRFSRATIAITASSLAGTVVAFVRPSPVEQHVDTGGVNNGEFAGQRWLIVGGSRGLGAAAVRLLTAGGAEVRFTYHRGTDDAAAIYASTGAAAARLDVFNQALPDSLLAAMGPDWAPTHLGWFASPPIFVGARGTYSTPLFDRFRSAYVDAFSTAIEHLVPRGLMAALWPSSEAVDTDVPGLAEYADAKRLGELRCRELERSYPPLHIATPRLPRLLTDQSTSFVPVEFGDTAIEILAALRATLRER